jgi:hypothetical protein
MQRHGSTLRRTARFSLCLAVLIGCLGSAASAASAGILEVGNFASGPLDETLAPSTTAGAHPFELTTSFELNTTENGQGAIVPAENLKNVEVDLPPGIVGNAASFPQCPQERMDELANCPVDTQVGVARLTLLFFGPGERIVPIYNLVPPPGMPAQFGFKVIGSITHIDFRVRSGGDYGVTASLTNINPTAPVYNSAVSIWGVPAASGHDTLRFETNAEAPGFEQSGAPLHSQAPKVPFLTNPTACTGPLTAQLRLTTWQNPGETVIDSAEAPGMGECGSVPFKPSLNLGADTARASSPTGISVDLHLPQHENVQGITTSALKRAVVILPEGVALSPGSADGLQACSNEQVGLGSAAAPNCPAASKLGAVSIATPLLKQPLTGSMYLGTQLSNDPTSGQMYRLFLVASGFGVSVKLPGSVVADPATGQLTASFDDAPQLPFEDVHIALNGGPRAPLKTPRTCGTYTTRALLTPWAAPAAEAVESISSFQIDQTCDAAAAFSPGLEAGSSNPLAGRSSPFLLEVTGEEGQQNLRSIDVTLPEGLLAKLAGVPLCSDAQAASGACDAGSRIGSVTVAAGEGANPLYVPQPGKAATAVYLAGPYKGAPYSLVFDVPAQAGPFDLGEVVVRAALRIDPVTTQVTAASEPLPQILGGVPIQYRTVFVAINRDGFMRNGTSCAPAAVTSTITSAAGAVAHPSSHYQLADCSVLPFSPRLRLEVSGPTRRATFPGLTATLKAERGQANIARVAVTLPHSEFLEQGHIRTICTRVQYAADNCPKGSVYGHAKAYSPLLDKPLEGPVYLRSSNHQLPDLVASLDGQIHVDLAGRIDSPHGKGIRTTFAAVPDAPVTKFVLTMQGGKKGLLVNSRNLCLGPDRANVAIEGQNGKSADQRPLLANDCRKRRK